MTMAPCPDCGGDELYRHRGISSGAARGIRLLPELGGLGYYADVSVVVCRACGLTRLFASEEARAKLGSAVGWKRVAVAPREAPDG